MRCPACNSENLPAAAYCGECGRRLFTWFGDPFGNQSPPGIVDRAPALPMGILAPVGPAVAVAAPRPAGRPRTLTVALLLGAVVTVCCVLCACAPFALGIMEELMNEFFG